MERMTGEPQPALPTGTITFLFTDIEGSTPLWERQPAAMGAAVARHHAILHAAAEAHHGHVFKIVGDEFQIAFELPAQALRAALAAQRALRDEPWGETGPLKVRMGLHTGPAELVEGVLNTRDYAVSHTLNRVARIRSAAHGGQVLLSLATAELLRGHLPGDVTLKDLGEYYPKGLAQAEHIFQVIVPDLPSDFPPLTVPSRPLDNLPVPPTPFVGRHQELAELQAFLTKPEVRLVTVVGAGGIGKTRLALEAAAAGRERYPHGVFFAPLARLPSAEGLVPAVADALGFTFVEEQQPYQERRDSRQQLLDHLRRRSLLLVLDNLEQLLPSHPLSPPPGAHVLTHSVGRTQGGVADLLADLLQVAPGVQVLATSRARLNLQGEHLFHLSGMPYPQWSGEGDDDWIERTLAELREGETAQSALRLLLAGARRVQPGFTLTRDNLADVVQICHLVGGTPLGILLAASWVEMLRPREIAAEVGRDLDFLTSELQDLPERQRSMRAVFDYSWRLLNQGERETAAGLSVFRGGFTVEAAQAVSGASLRDLLRLVGRSLLERGADGRYQMHELLRQYLAGQLERTPEVQEATQERHCDYYTAALGEWAADLKGPRHREALAELDAAFENARAAWEWAAEHAQVERLDRALEGLCLYYWRRWRFLEGEAACRLAESRLAARLSLDEQGFRDGIAEGAGPSALSGDEPVLESAGTRDPRPEGSELRVWAKVLAWQGCFNHWLGLRELDRQLLGRSLALLEAPALADQDTRAEKAFALLAMGWVKHLYDYEDAQRLFEQSLALYGALGDRWWTAYVLRTLASSAHRLGNYGQAQQLHEESLAIRRSLGDQRGIADSLSELGVTFRAQGQLEKAERLYREGLAICRQMDDRAGIADGLGYLGEVRVQLGKFAEGCASLEAGLAIYDELGLPRNLAKANVALGEAHAHLGQYEGARTFGGTGLNLYREIDLRWGIGYARYVLGMVAVAEEAYAEAHPWLLESVSVLREVGHRENLAYALAVLGYAARGLGKLSQAQVYLHEALGTAAGTGAFMPFVLALPAVALLLADRGDAQGTERAAELYALASRYPFVANSRWFEDVAGRRVVAIAASLPPQVVAAAQERGRARDRETTVAQLLAELGEREAGDGAPQ
jgi:predicted ATPase/class 3 adenylate cyclase